jgi:hypothetical protein
LLPHISSSSAKKKKKKKKKKSDKISLSSTSLVAEPDECVPTTEGAAGETRIAATAFLPYEKVVLYYYHLVFLFLFLNDS